MSLEPSALVELLAAYEPTTRQVVIGIFAVIVALIQLRGRGGGDRE